jgi:Spy/CpxP family protein refolding chaperone
VKEVKSQKSESISHKPQASSLIVGLLVLLAVGIGPAQPPPNPGPGPGGPHNAQPAPNRKLEALRIWRLTQELNLSEDQAAQFFPKLKRIRELRQEHRVARQAMLDELDSLLAQEPVEPAGLKSVLDSLNTIDDNMHESELKLRQEIADLLTVEQQARLYVFEASFDRQARRMIEQIQEDKDKPGRKQ